MRIFLSAALLLLLAGCGPDDRIEQEREARVEAVRQVHVEQHRREFWQQAAYGGAALAILALIAGVALGSAPRKRVSDHIP